MESILLKVLEKESTIIIPDLGAIIKVGEVYQFNRFLKYNDGKLEGFVSTELNLDKEKSKEKIKDYLETINESFSSTGKYELKGIGKLEKVGDNISFVKGSIIKPKVEEKAPKTVVKTEKEKLPTKKVEKVEPVKEKPKKEESDSKIENKPVKTETPKKAENSDPKSAAPEKTEKNKIVRSETEVKKEAKVVDANKDVSKSKSIEKTTVVKEKSVEVSSSNSSLKDVSFFELLKDKKGEKYQAAESKPIEKTSAKVKEEGKVVEVSKDSTNSKAAEKTVAAKETVVASSPNSSLKEVSFFELLKDKKGEKYQSVDAKPIEKTASSKKEEVKVESSLKSAANLESTDKKSSVNEKPAVVSGTSKDVAKSNSSGVKKDEPILKEKKKRKKFPVLLIILLLLLLLLGGAGYYFKNHVTGYYNMAINYFDSSSVADVKDLTSDGSQHKTHDSHKKDHKESEIVSNEQIDEIEEEYIGDSEVEGGEHATEIKESLVENSENEKELESEFLSDHPASGEEISEEESKEEEIDLAKDNETDIEEENIEVASFEEEVESEESTESNNEELAKDESESSEIINKLKAKIEDLKTKLTKSVEENNKNKALISELKSKISTLENKLQNSSNTSTSNVSSSSSNGRYKVIVGSFSKRSYAERKVDGLKESGYSNSYLVGKYGGLYIVSIGDYDSKEEARTLKEKYSSSGGSCFIKKN